MPTLMCLSITLSHRWASPASWRKNIPLTDLERYGDVLPSDGKSAHGTIQNTGVGKVSFAPLSLHQYSPPPPFFSGRYEYLTFFSIYQKILSAINHLFFFLKKGPILIHCLLLIMTISIEKMLILRALFPKNVFKIQFSFVIIFFCSSDRVWSIQVETFAYLN